MDLAAPKPLKRRDSNASITSRLSRISSRFSALSFKSADGEQPPGKYVVVYEPLDKKVWMDTPENVEKKEHVKIKAPGTKMVVELNLPIGPNGDVTMRIGTVNLGVLRSSAKKLRAKGKIHHIYILGKLPEGFGNIDEVIEE